MNFNRFIFCSGREAEDEYDFENSTERRGQDRICESVTENERHADAALSHGHAESVPTLAGIYRSVPLFNRVRISMNFFLQTFPSF